MHVNRVTRVVLAAALAAPLSIGSAASSRAQTGSLNGQPAQPDLKTIQTISPEDLGKLVGELAPPTAPPPKDVGDWNGSWYGSVLLPGQGLVPVTLTMSGGQIVSFDVGQPYRISSDKVTPDTITFSATNSLVGTRVVGDSAWDVTVTASGNSLSELQVGLKGATQTLTTTLDFRTSPPPQAPAYLAPGANNPPGFFNSGK